MTTSTARKTAQPKTYRSLEEMRAQYANLVSRYMQNRAGEPSPEFLKAAAEFLARGLQTGTILDEETERLDAQSMLNYWATILYRYRSRPEEDPPVTILALFGNLKGTRPSGKDVLFLAPQDAPAVYVGRQQFLADLKQRLFSERNVAMYGLTGTGKTLLSTKIAHDPETREKFSDGVLWASLGNRPDVSAILDTWRKALNLPEDASDGFLNVESRQKEIRQALAQRRMLIILDDVWQAEDALALKLGGSKCAHVITTYALSVAMEFEVEATVAIPGLKPSEGLRLLAESMPEAVRIQEDEARQLVALLEGSPMALTLFAKCYSGRASDLNQLRQRLADKKRAAASAQPSSSVTPLADQAQTPPSLLATLDWCCAHLSQAEKNTLQALAVFPPKPNSFSEAAALSITAESSDRLETLLRCGLLEPGEPGRYTLHRAASDYLNRLPEEHADAPARRMVAFFVALVKSRKTDIISLWRQEEQNILAALDIAFHQKLWEPFIDGTNELIACFVYKGLYVLAKERLEQALRAAKLAHDEKSQASLLLHLGEMEERLQEYSGAMKHLNSALRMAKKIHDDKAAARALQLLGVVVMSQANYPLAEKYLAQALKLTRKNGDAPRDFEDAKMQCAVYTRLGWLERGRGDYPKSREYSEQGLELARKNQKLAQNSDDSGQMAELFLQMAELFLNLGVVAYEEGKYDLALSHDREGLVYAKEADHPLLQCGLLQALGGVEIKREKFKEAQRYLLDSLHLAEKMGHRWYASLIWKEFGELRLAQKSLNAASEAFVKALDIAREVSSPESVGKAIFGLAQVAAARENYSEARLQGQTSLNIFHSISHAYAGKTERWIDGLPQ